MPGFRRAVTIVAALNLAYFGIEAAVAALIGSVSLLADSVDFLEDAAINTLIAFALAWSAQRRMIVGRVAALIIVAVGGFFVLLLAGPAVALVALLIDALITMAGRITRSSRP